MANIVLKDGAGDEETYYDIKTISLPTEDGGTQVFELETNKVEKAVELDMADGDQVVECEEGTLMTKVTITKPSGLLSENIRQGVIIGGVEGTISIPKLNAPTITASDSSQYDTIAVLNPTENGGYATSLRCMVDGELVTVKTPASPGEALSIAEVSLFNGIEGPQTLGFSYSADGFETSEVTEHETSMYSVTISPENVNDGYDYPAIKAGAEYQGTVSEKNATRGYLPPVLDVTKDGKECGFSWDNDVGFDTSQSGNYMATRCRNGALSVPSVDGPLAITIPYTEQPQLNPVEFSVQDGILFATPPPYAEQIKVLVDGEEYLVIQGITYELSEMDGDNDFSLSGGLFGSLTGNVPQAYYNNESSGAYKLCKVKLNVPEQMDLTLRCFFYADSPTNNYGLLSNLDTDFTASSSETTSNIYKSFSGLSGIKNQFVTYTVPEGEHYFYAKARIGTSSGSQTVFGFILWKLCSTKKIKFQDYGLHTVTAIASASNCLDSESIECTYQLKPICSLDSYILTVGNLLEGVEELELFVNGESVATVPYDGSGEFHMDMRNYPDHPGNCSIYVRAFGNGLEGISEEISGYVNQPPVYGVSGLYQSDPLMTRTDDAVGLSYTINEDGTIQSDFDNLFPWSDAKLVSDTNGNQFLQMPEMYFRVQADSAHRLTDIAVSAMPGTDGSWYKVAPFCFGCYATNYNGNTSLVSKSGIAMSKAATRANLRIYARNNGSGYQINDLYHQTVMKFLWWIEWATKNAPSIMTGCCSGTGTTGGTSYPGSGGTDKVSTPSGYELTRCQMRWHYIEDFLGGVSEYLDGVYMTGASSYSYATSDPTKFVDSTSGLSKLAYKNPATSYCIMAYGWDDNNPFLCLPCENTSTASYTEYFCTRAYNYSSSYIVLVEGTNYYWSGSTLGGNNNGFVNRCCAASTSFTNYGTRLLYHGKLE